MNARLLLFIKMKPGGPADHQLRFVLPPSYENSGVSSVTCPCFGGKSLMRRRRTLSTIRNSLEIWLPGEDSNL